MKPLYALVAESCKHKAVLDKLFSTVPGLKGNSYEAEFVTRVLVTELLWGKGYLKPENAKAIRSVLQLEQDLRRAVQSPGPSEDCSHTRGRTH